MRICHLFGLFIVVSINVNAPPIPVPRDESWRTANCGLAGDGEGER